MKPVDQKVYDLAVAFLADVKNENVDVRDEDKQKLAEEIQTTIEDFISDLRKEKQS